VLVGVLVNRRSSPLFAADERVDIVREVFREYPERGGANLQRAAGGVRSAAAGECPYAAFAPCRTSSTSSRWR
jgi:hypothetical protein